MSEQYGITVDQASKIVRQMIKDKYKLSSANYNSLYLYTSDGVRVASVSEYRDDNKKYEYLIELLNVSDIRSLKINQTFYSEIILALARREEGAFNGKIKKVNMADFQKYYEDNKYLGADVIIDTVKYLIENNCTTDCLNRSYYFFDKNVDNPAKNHAGIWELNHENKLVKYDMSKGQQWFLVSSFGSCSFSPLKKQSQQMFGAVKIALKKQNQNVK